MAHTLAMRATSLVASAGILGVLLLAALSATYVVQQIAMPDPATEVSIIDPPAPPPDPPPRPLENTRPLQPNTVATEELPQTLIDTTEPPTGTTVPFTPPGPMSITNPRWLERPSNLARYYPRRAVERGVEGFVLLDCIVATTGLLNCDVISETPSGWNFGDAALRIAADHRMAPAMRDGVAVQGRYRMRVPFELNQ
jgi:periplasmic protein TonB